MDDLLREFLTETNESLDTVDVELVRFEQEPNNAKILDNIFRLVHTIKGTCGFLGLPRLEALAHAAETLMGKFRDGMPVTGEAVTLILSTIDRLKEVLGGLEQNEAEPEGDDSDLIGELERMAMEGTVPAAAADRQEAPKPAKAAVNGTLVAQTLERAAAPGRSLARRARARLPRDRAEAAPAPKAEAAKAEKAEARQGRAQAGRRGGRGQAGFEGRQPVDPRQRRDARTPDDHGLGAGAHPQPAARDRAPARGLRVQGAAAAALQRHRRAAGRRHEDAHAADRQCLAEAAAHRARPRRASSSKDIELEMHGAETELDRQVLDLIKDPLTHMVRNSADHGLETPEQRRAAEKPEKGTIRLSAYHEGGHIIIEIADDGRGLNTARIKAEGDRATASRPRPKSRR